MSDKNRLTLLAKAVGITVVTGLVSMPIASASENPFAMKDLGSGYKIAAAEEGKCGEGKCGGDMAKKDKAKKDGNCGGKEHKDGECGEGKCGADKADKMKAGKDGECGEGKCGADKADEKKAKKDG